MSGLCGWIGGLSGDASAEHLIQSMGRHLTRFDSTSLEAKTGDQYGVAVAAPRGRASIVVSEGYAAAVWGNPAFNDSVLAQCARASTPAHAVIEGTRRFGSDCCAKLSGAFAIAVINESTGEALLAIDRMGIHNIVYRQQPDRVVFGSTAHCIAPFPNDRREIDWQSIYNYVHFHMVPGPATAIRGEQRLLPGQFIHVRKGQAQVGRYWTMAFVENEEHPFDELKAEFLGTLESAVGRMSAAAETGAFLSGGTDSSTVSGLLGKVTGKPAHTFSIGFAEQGYDEMEFARIAAKHFRTDQHEYYVTPADIVDAIPRLAAIYDQPFGNSSAVPTYCCARFARQNGMELLLGGDGGDELFGGNERYATQRRFGYYDCVPSAIRKGMLEPLARIMPGGSVVPPIRWYRRLIQLAATPMPERMDAHNLLLRLGAQNVFTPEFLQSITPEGPLHSMRKIYDEADAGTLINKMLAYDFQFTLADSDLPKVVKSCELAGLPVEFPMLDDRLVAFSARLAPELKLKGTKLRYFFKEALRGFLPDEIITKSKHGFGLPFGPWLRSHKPLEDLVMDNLRGLKDRGFIRPDFIDQLMMSHLQQHAGYYGTMAWVLVMLNQWFESEVVSTHPG
jgi:asparagine synthase (glutamine-hydrolysing)